MPGGGVPEWFGRGEEEKATRRKRGSGGGSAGGGGGSGGGSSGGGGSKVIAFSAVAIAAIGGVIAFNFTKQSDEAARAEAHAAARAEEKLRAEKARKRMLAEIKKAAEATPEPEPVDPSDLPSIDEVLAEDAEEAEEEDEAAGEDAGAVGKRDSASVLRITRALNPQVQRCYETQLARDPDLRGRANVTLQISEEGRVSKATVQLVGQLPASMRGCIAGVFRKARFEPASDVATVKLPIIFSANR